MGSPSDLSPQTSVLVSLYSHAPAARTIDRATRGRTTVSDPGFVVGGRYENTAGVYDVIAIDASSVRIRYANGFEMSLPAQGLWFQYEALVAERTGRPIAPVRPA